MQKILAICLLCSSLFGAWVMFNDGEDTYIYNNLNGDIFIRHRSGGENYEDKFIKMPAGVIPKELQKNNDKNNDSANKTHLNSYNNTQNIPKEQVDALEKRFQELESNLLNKALE